ncbi:hypothetical protein IHE45_16G055700 [Dioscorea alata]|uniref:Uncharacterized protein n=1 Tax=Dioscorea alata TaxID=55571 RepID=A0ACB7UHN6_DIOAL|nr:hypothetical protein IHE45_16G055700 [Dioscorea alata]
MVLLLTDLRFGDIRILSLKIFLIGSLLRDTLNQEVENLREEKLKATNIQNKIWKTEEELVQLAEENEQLDLDEKGCGEDLEKKKQE